MIDEGVLLAGRYRLVSQVGTGAMGVVWKAHDEHLNRVVAVKQLLHAGVSEAEAEETYRRAMREARIAARLNHPHAIAVYDMVEHERRPYLIMEYLRSESLSTVMAERGPLPPAEVARIGSQIAAALAAAHEVGIVHRDVKPGNVLLAADGTAKITDFGISRAAGDCTVTATGVVLGTPAYLAPEVARGQPADFPADVFALGSTLYAAVEGTPPFGVDDNPLALLYRIVNNEIIPPERSGPLTSVLSCLLDCDLSRRPTMRQAWEALATAPTAPLTTVGAPVTSGVSPTASTRPVSTEPVSSELVSPGLVSVGPVSAGPALSATASLPARTRGPTAEVALAGPGAAEGGARPRRPAAAFAAAVASLMVGLMLVVILTNHGNDTARPPADTPSTTPGGAPNQQAPRSAPPAEDAEGAVPAVATLPGPAPVVRPEPSRVAPPAPSAAPPASPGAGAPSGSTATSSTETSPEPSRDSQRVADPDPSQVPDPERGPAPSTEPSPDPSPVPEDDLAPGPPSGPPSGGSDR